MSISRIDPIEAPNGPFSPEILLKLIGADLGAKERRPLWKELGPIGLTPSFAFRLNAVLQESGWCRLDPSLMTRSEIDPEDIQGRVISGGFPNLIKELPLQRELPSLPVPAFQVSLDPRRGSPRIIPGCIEPVRRDSLVVDTYFVSGTNFYPLIEASPLTLVKTPQKK